MRHLIGASVLLATLFCGVRTFAQVWDFVADFETGFTDGAPNGAWKYGFSETLGGEFIGMKFSGGVHFGLQGYRGDLSGPYEDGYHELAMGVNRTGATLDHAGVFWLQNNEGYTQPAWPGPTTRKSIARWTAPDAGSYDVDAWFGGGYIGETTTDVHVYLNGESLLTDMVIGYAGDDLGDDPFGANPIVTYNSNLSLNAGDIIDMIVGDGGSAGGDPTRVKMVVTLADSPMVPGDFNNNGFVDAADYVLWRAGGPLENDPTPGVQPEDYDFWRSQFGNSAGSGTTLASSGSVPEPSSVALAGLCILGGLAYASGTRIQRR